ncbi:hypothetical protein COV18_00030 [Candidatus Woesearchaeota archaeon CG10_big_fil_rev_8_21_14_0_10_37_12]|nr:MAG: hypothetical protein COV18_00030 [Candidatus Woesearchaeota archaeon CG10_big_fil_rev_8_21_14_0_10_37_12]
MKYLKLATRSIQIHLNKEFAYKADFITKIISTMIADFVGPLLAIIIYNTTIGIPGWTLHEFLLFQGTLIMVLGLTKIFILSMFWHVYEAVEEGQFHKYLLKPYNSLLFLMAISIDWQGIVEFTVGALIASYAMSYLNINFISFGFLFYIILILLGVLFHAAIYTMISAGSIIAVKNEALLHLFFKLTDFARWPLTVFGIGFQIFLTFFFPIAVSAFYPVDVLLRGVSIPWLIAIILPVLAAFGISIWMWSYAIKKHTSAGG